MAALHVDVEVKSEPHDPETMDHDHAVRTRQNWEVIGEAHISSSCGHGETVSLMGLCEYSQSSSASSENCHWIKSEDFCEIPNNRLSECTCSEIKKETAELKEEQVDTESDLEKLTATLNKELCSDSQSKRRTHTKDDAVGSYSTTFPSCRGKKEICSDHNSEMKSDKRHPRETKNDAVCSGLVISEVGSGNAVVKAMLSGQETSSQHPGSHRRSRKRKPTKCFCDCDGEKRQRTEVSQTLDKKGTAYKNDKRKSHSLLIKKSQKHLVTSGSEHSDIQDSLCSKQGKPVVVLEDISTKQWIFKGKAVSTLKNSSKRSSVAVHTKIVSSPPLLCKPTSSHSKISKDSPQKLSSSYDPNICSSERSRDNVVTCAKTSASSSCKPISSAPRSSKDNVVTGPKKLLSAASSCEPINNSSESSKDSLKNLSSASSSSKPANSSSESSNFPKNNVITCPKQLSSATSLCEPVNSSHRSSKDRPKKLSSASSSYKPISSSKRSKDNVVACSKALSSTALLCEPVSKSSESSKDSPKKLSSASLSCKPTSSSSERSNFSKNIVVTCPPKPSSTTSSCDPFRGGPERSEGSPKKLASASSSEPVNNNSKRLKDNVVAGSKTLSSTTSLCEPVNNNSKMSEGHEAACDNKLSSVPTPAFLCQPASCTATSVSECTDKPGYKADDCRVGPDDKSMSLIYPYCCCDLRGCSVKPPGGHSELSHVVVIHFMNKRIFAFVHDGRPYMSFLELSELGLLPHKDHLELALLKVKSKELRGITEVEMLMLGRLYPRVKTGFCSVTLLTPSALIFLYKESMRLDSSSAHRYRLFTQNMFYMQRYNHKCPWTLLITPSADEHVLRVLKSFPVKGSAPKTLYTPRILSSRNKAGAPQPGVKNTLKSSAKQALITLLGQFGLTSFVFPCCQCEMTTGDLVAGKTHHQVCNLAFLKSRIHCWIRPKAIFVSVQELKFRALLPWKKSLVEDMLLTAKDEEDRTHLTSTEITLLNSFACSITGELNTYLINVRYLRLIYRCLAQVDQKWIPHAKAQYSISLLDHHCPSSLCLNQGMSDSISANMEEAGSASRMPVASATLFSNKVTAVKVTTAPAELSAVMAKTARAELLTILKGDKQARSVDMQVMQSSAETSSSQSVLGVEDQGQDEHFELSRYPKACKCKPSPNPFEWVSFLQCTVASRYHQLLLSDTNFGQAVLLPGKLNLVLYTVLKNNSYYFSVGELQSKGYFSPKFDLGIVPCIGPCHWFVIASESECKLLKQLQVNLRVSRFGQGLISAELLCHLTAIAGCRANSLTQSDIYVLQIGHICPDTFSLAYLLSKPSGVVTATLEHVNRLSTIVELGSSAETDKDYGIAIRPIGQDRPSAQSMGQSRTIQKESDFLMWGPSSHTEADLSGLIRSICKEFCIHGRQAVFEGKCVIRRSEWTPSPPSSSSISTAEAREVNHQFIRSSLGADADEYWIILTGQLSFTSSSLKLAVMKVEEEIYMNWNYFAMSVGGAEHIFQLGSLLKAHVLEPPKMVNSHFSKLYNAGSRPVSSPWFSLRTLHAVYNYACRVGNADVYPKTFSRFKTLFVDQTPHAHFQGFLLVRKMDGHLIQKQQ